MWGAATLCERGLKKENHCSHHIRDDKLQYFGVTQLKNSSLDVSLADLLGIHILFSRVV